MTQATVFDSEDQPGRRIAELEAQLEEARHRMAEMERARRADDVGDYTVPISEFEETLRRLVQRTAMIVQAEKCVIMVRDRETGDLIARSPAFGMTDEEVRTYRVPVDMGVSGMVFRTGEPTIFHDTNHDDRLLQELVDRLKIHNGVTVPLLVERRDASGATAERIAIGVLHCFNKRYDAEFIDEDVRLLERLSRNAASVIANAQAFRDVLEEKQQLVHTLESLTAGLLLINHRGRIGQMNAKARAMFCVDEAIEPIGRDYRELIHHDECLRILDNLLQRAGLPAVAQELDDDGSRHVDEITVTGEEEQYFYQVHAANVRGDNDEDIGTAFIFNDVTDIRNVERMKTEFVSIVSHELRTPLTPMKGFVSTLLQDPDEEFYTRADRREFYEIIDQNVDRLRRLIDDLLNVSRIEKTGIAGIEMTFEMADLRQATDEVLAIQRGMTDRHTLIADFDPEHILAEVDPDKIQNILQNLVSNAIKYSPAGGEVRVTCRLEAETETVLIGVKDEGTGIAEAAQKKLFQKFYRVDNKSTRKVGGTGIGLFLVKNLVEAHNGSIWVDSKAGCGSTFWVRLPVHQPRPETTAAAGQ
ncbi:MAG: GAF domain-containing protein [Armatimonadetes bacterium]|nr:GAF domain-containing protein [Armatimonadota bacterium]MDE2206548.1 GAF domain-containing protein [Armatimonadota bacterium]